MSTWTRRMFTVACGRAKSKRPTHREERWGYVSEDGLFAIHETYPDFPGAGFTITHVTSGYSLSKGHSNRRNAELFAAIWRALPISWDKDLRAIDRAYRKMPAQLLAWVKAVSPQPEDTKTAFAFDIAQDGFRIVALWPDDHSDAKVTLYRNDVVLREFLYPAYKVYNLAAHFSDIIASELEGDVTGYEIAGSDGLGGCVMPKVMK